MVSGLHVAHLFANELHNAGRLMTQNHWQWMRVIPRNEVQVGTANSTRSGPYQNLMAFRLINLYIFYAEWLTDFS